MKRSLILHLSSGDAEEENCGDCPFRSPDLDLWHEAKYVRELCMNPIWHLPDVTGGERHQECLAAEAEVRKLIQIERAAQAVVKALAHEEAYHVAPCVLELERALAPRS